MFSRDEGERKNTRNGIALLKLMFCVIRALNFISLFMSLEVRGCYLLTRCKILNCHYNTTTTSIQGKSEWASFINVFCEYVKRGPL